MQTAESVVGHAGFEASITVAGSWQAAVCLETFTTKVPVYFNISHAGVLARKGAGWGFRVVH
jgi:hypothetical protein